MKNTLALVSTLVLGAAAASASAPCNSFNGWSAGINAGWSGSSVKNTDDGAADSNLNKTSRLNHMPVGVHFDWTKSKPNALLLGVGFGLGYSFGNPSKTIYENGADKFSISSKRKFNIDMTGRLGWNLSGKTALYALASVRGTQVEYSASGLATRFNDRYSINKFVWGFAPGAGFDVKINQKWSAGAEYRYLIESKISKKDAEGDNVSAKARSHNLVARVSYHF